MLNKRKLWKFVLQVIVIGLVYFAIQAYHKRDSASGLAPPLYGKLLDGNHVEPQMYKGRSYVVHFWATWCTVCRIEQDSINSIAEDYPVIAIASQSGSEQEVTKYTQNNEIRFPVLVDEGGEFARQYGVRAYPTTFVVNGDGDIQFVEVGYTTELGLRSRLKLAR